MNSLDDAAVAAVDVYESAPTNTKHPYASSPARRSITEGGTGCAGVWKQLVLVGTDHQATVPKYNPALQYANTRVVPKVVWKVNSIKDEALNDFAHRLAELHTPYIRGQKLTATEAYSPLNSEDLEREWRLRSSDKDVLPTGSTFGTASALSADRRCALLKECDLDTVLELLHDNGYDVNRLMGYLSFNLDVISCGWTMQDKSIYTREARSADGDLDGIAKKMIPHKTYREIVDYYYRYHIPDKFRILRNRVRSRAVQTLRALNEQRRQSSGIEDATGLGPSACLAAADAARNQYERRGVDRTAPVPAVSLVAATAASQHPDRHHHSHRATKKRHWSNTSISQVAVAVNDRVNRSRSFLLDVYEIAGQDSVLQMTNFILTCDEANPQIKNTLLKALNGYPDLQRRMLEFLPG
jgi:hypothetical protein